MSKTEYTPGAMRAAEKIVKEMLDFMISTMTSMGDTDCLAHKIAAIVDEETNAPELLKALKRLSSYHNVWERIKDTTRPDYIPSACNVLGDLAIDALTTITKAEETP